MGRQKLDEVLGKGLADKIMGKEKVSFPVKVLNLVASGLLTFMINRFQI